MNPNPDMSGQVGWPVASAISFLQIEGFDASERSTLLNTSRNYNNRTQRCQQFI